MQTYSPVPGMPEALIHLTTPLLEAFPTSQPFLDILAVRSGPDRLDLETFDSAPWQVVAAAYWFQRHTWCEDPECRCVFSPRAADGFCVVTYADGLLGFHRLWLDFNGPVTIDWQDQDSRIDEARLLQIRAAMEAPDVTIGSAPQSACEGVWLAYDDARRRGLFAGREPPGCETSRSRREATGWAA